MQSVDFSLGNEEYGIAVEKVDEIIRYSNPAMLPRADPSVLGVINLRNRVIPIYCLRTRFGMMPIGPTNETRIIIGQLNDQLVGFAVDSVAEVLEIAENQIEKHDGAVYGVKETFFQGIARLGNRLVIL